MKGYTEYKKSATKWLEKVPTHWRKTRMKNIGFLYAGLSGKRGEDFSKIPQEGFTPFIPFTNIANNHILNIGDYQYVNVEANEKQNSIQKNDLFFLMSSENYEDVGKSAILQEEVGEIYLNSFCKGYRITDKNTDASFLNYLLSGNVYRQNVLTKANGFTRINLKMSGIADLEIYLPTLGEQKKIANFLDQKTALIDGAISKRNQLIELLNEERKAIINEAVTQGIDPNIKMKGSGIEWIADIPEHWEVQQLKYVFKFGRGLSITKKDLQKKGIPCLNYGEIHSKYGFRVDPDIHKLKCVPKEHLENSQNSLLELGDFVFADTSEDLEGSGNFSFLDSEKQVFAGYHTVVLKQKADNQYKYLGYLFDSLAFRTQIQKKVKGVKVYSITQSILKGTFLLLPPIKEQASIADYLDKQTDQIDQEISSTQKEIDLLTEYRQSLITEAVTGKIDVRDYPLN